MRKITKSKTAPKEVTDAQLHRRSQKKTEGVAQLASKVRSLRAKLNQDLRSEDQKTFLTALAIYTMLQTSERVGNPESASNGHFGVTGFKKSQIKVNGNKTDFNYVGKSGVKHEKTISNETLADAYKKALKISKSNNVFETTDGFKIKADKVNRYLSDYGVTAKDIRGYSANKWIVSRLKRINPHDTEAKRKTQFNKILADVAERVGHGRATLKKHYLLPDLETKWIDQGKIIELKTMAKGGQLKTNNGKKGGKLEGQAHSECTPEKGCGIKAIITDDDGRPVELEGGELIVNKITSNDDREFIVKGTPSEIISTLNSMDGNGVSWDEDAEIEEVGTGKKHILKKGGRLMFKDGGKTSSDKDEIYNKWRSLVNMSASELKKFMNTKEGKEAGLTKKQADDQGIDSGRESAGWILKMKSTPKSNWTDNMWKWANKQISFISRMSGMQGDLYDEKGNKTRKHTALLIWGHNPEKKKAGGKMKKDVNNIAGRKKMAKGGVVHKPMDRYDKIISLMKNYGFDVDEIQPTDTSVGIFDGYVTFTSDKHDSDDLYIINYDNLWWSLHNNASKEDIMKDSSLLDEEEYADGGKLLKLEKSLSNAEKNYRKAIQSEQVGIISSSELQKAKNRVDNARKKVNEWYASRPLGVDKRISKFKIGGKLEEGVYVRMLENLDVKASDQFQRPDEEFIDDWQLREGDRLKFMGMNDNYDLVFAMGEKRKIYFYIDHDDLPKLGLLIKNKKQYPVEFENHRWYREVFNTPRDQETVKIPIYEGMPVTYTIGSDSYGIEVLEIIENKNGTLKEIIVGDAKTGEARNDYDRLRYNKNKKTFRPVGGGYGSYYFGEKQEKRDPSFEKGGKIDDLIQTVARKVPSDATASEIYNELSNEIAKGYYGEVYEDDMRFLVLDVGKAQRGEEFAKGGKMKDDHLARIDRDVEAFEVEKTDNPSKPFIFHKTLLRKGDHVFIKDLGEDHTWIIEFANKTYHIHPENTDAVVPKVPNWKRKMSSGGKVYKVPVGIQRKIDELNDLIKWAEDKDNFVSSYFGTTVEHLIIFKKPVTVKNQFVYIEYEKGYGSEVEKERYNLNDTDEFSWNGRVALNHELSQLLRAFRKAKKSYDTYGYFAKGGKTDNWLQEANAEMKKDHTVGAFTKQAKRAGMQPVAFAKKVLANPDKYTLRTRRRAQYVKNANPEKFAGGGQVKYPTKYLVTVYSGDMMGRRASETPQLTYTHTVNNREEDRKFLESLDGGSHIDVTTLK